MSKRRVKFLTPQYFDDRSYIGGGERLPLNWARGLAAASGGAYEVEILSFGDRPSRTELFPGVALRVLQAARRPSDPLDVVSWELPSALEEADLVHIHQPFTRCGEFGLLAAKQQGKLVCASDHGGGTSTLGMSLGCMELADRIVAYSEFGTTFFRTKRPIEVIKGGVDGGFFIPPEQRPPRDRFLYVGRLLPHKGIDRIIDALPPELPLTIHGRPYHTEYYKYLRERARGKQVEFSFDRPGGGDETIRDLYRRAWANILPSVYRDCYGQAYSAPELMGLTLLEAMGCGTPAICSRVGGMPEFVRHGETGFIFDDVHELSGYLRLLAGDSAMVEQIGGTARRAVEQEFDLRVVGARLAAVYDELISTTREAAA